MKFSIFAALFFFAHMSCFAEPESGKPSAQEADLRKSVDLLTAENTALREELSKSKGASATNLLIVHVTEKIGFLVDGKMLTEGELTEKLKSLFSKDKGYFILIQTHKFGPYQSIMVVMEVCEKIGLKNVFYQVPKE